MIVAHQRVEGQQVLLPSVGVGANNKGGKTEHKEKKDVKCMALLLPDPESEHLSLHNLVVVGEGLAVALDKAGHVEHHVVRRQQTSTCCARQRLADCAECHKDADFKRPQRTGPFCGASFCTRCCC